MQQKIFLKDIDYIESANKKVLVHTSGGVTEGYGKMEPDANAVTSASG